MSLRNLTLRLTALLLACSLCGGCAGSQTETPIPITASITPAGALVMIQEIRDNDLVIIDLRSAEEFAQGHIENAVNTAYRPETFRTEIKRRDKDKACIIYYSCSCGGIDEDARSIMAELGFREVYSISGGIEQWQAEGQPVTK